jgi:cytochrome c551/c552
MVKDDENATAKSDAISVYAGNDAPVVTIDVVGNESFYFPGKPVVYTTSVTDKNDTSVARDLKNVFITADYVEGSDKAGASMGHQIVSDVMMGRSLVQSLDCKSCHKEAEKSIGPAYVNVAKKYQAQPNAITYLVNKVIKGGSGVWGETVMPAHPTLTETDARKMISWVLTLAGGANAQKSLPVKGSVNPTLNKKPMDNGMLILSASYTDKGSAGTKPLMGSTAVVLRSNKMSGANAHNLNGYTTMTYNGLFLLMVPKAEASFSLDSIDLTNVNQVAITFGWDKPPKFGYTFEAHLDGPGGKKIGEAKLPAGMKNVKGPGGFGSTTISINLVPVTDGKQHNLYLVSRPLNTAEEGTLIIVGTEFKSK